MFLQKKRLFSRVILGIFLVFSLIVTGCPGTSGSPALENPPNDGGGGNGGGYNPPGDSGIKPAEAAKNLADTLNGYIAGAVDNDGVIVTVLKSFNVLADSSMIRAIASDSVGSFIVPNGVTFLIPDEITVNVLAGGSITAPGTIQVGGTLQTVSGSTVTVTGTLKAAGGTITAAADTITVSGTLNVAEDSTVDSNIIVTGKVSGDGAGPVLTGTTVSYGSEDSAVSVAFTFDKAVEVTEPDSGAVSSNGNKTVTVTPSSTTSGTAVDISLTVTADSKSATVTRTVMPVSGTTLPSTGEYTVVYYDAYSANSSAVSLKTGEATSGYLVTDANWKKLFNTIYTPNAPGTMDAIESGKTTVAYDDTISEKALGLFNISFGASYAETKVLIKETDLPTGGVVDGPIVIDIGLPGTVDNAGLPKFYIPNQALGTSSGSYGGIRLRVNKGAEMIIEANNEGYISEGVGHSAPNGYFNYGTVEVMTGGKLRDGAYEGFPLGSNAVILNRAGSYLGIGPDEDSDDAKNGMAETYSKYYAGWLIGPSGSDPRIVWDNNQGYIEVRPTKLAISTNVTVKKSLGLIYSVWFVNAPTVTLDAAASPLTIEGLKGLFANGAAYKFYGTSGATVIVKPGNTLHKMFLTANGTDATNFITADSGTITITNVGTGTSLEYANGISGYPDWNVPE